MQIQPTANNAIAGQTNPTSENRSSLTSDYEMFLQMLTVQMTNQDPLNPVDSSDYAVQLATFSSVEQQVLTNELLLDLTSQMNASGLADLGAWIGREVKSSAPAHFDGEPVTVATNMPVGTSRATLDVLDANGILVQQFDLDVSQDQVTWAGIGSDGATLPNGLYTFQISAFTGDDLLGTYAAESYGRIEEARLTDDGTVLVLEGGAQVLPGSVTAVRG